MDDKVSIWKIISITCIIFILMIVVYLGAKYFIENKNNPDILDNDDFNESVDDDIDFFE